MLEYLLLLVSLLHACVRTRSDLMTENVLLRQQLAVLSRPTRQRSPLRGRDRLFWIMTRILRRDRRRHLVLVQPATVVRWHRQAWRLFWRWKSRPLGRPRLSAEVRELIATMAADNPTCGSERIRGELLKLGIGASKRSVQPYRRRRPARPPSQAWGTFLRNHAHAIWAADLFTVQTLTFETLYVLLLVKLRGAHGLADRFTRLRRQGLLTQEELGDALGVCVKTVQVWRHAGLLVSQRYNDKGGYLYEPPGANAPRKSQGTPLRLRQRPLVTDRPNEVQCSP